MTELLQKHILLIKLLMDSKEALSSSILSIALGISQKTVKTYLDVADEELKHNAGATIVSKSGSGIYIEVEDRAKYEKYYETFNFTYVGNKSVIRSISGDTGYLIRKLLYAEDDYISVDKICAELYKSRKPILKDLEKVESFFDNYHLKLKKKAGCGIMKSGKESHIRVAMADSFMARCVESYNDPFKAEYESYKTSLNKIITDNISRYNISIAQKSIDKLLRIILINESRMKKGHKLEKPYGNIENINRTFEYLCACDIYSELNIEADEAEKQFLTIMILSRRYISSNDSFDIRKEKEIYELSGEIIKDIYQQTHIDFSVYSKFRLDIARHLRAMYYRLKYGFEKRSVKTVESNLKNSYYEFSVIACRYIGMKWNVKVSENEIAYFSYIFYNQMLSQFKKYKSKILISSVEGRDTSNIIAWELMENWKKYIDEIEIVDNYLLDDIDLNDYDLLISDIPGFKDKGNIHNIYVNNFLNSIDFLRLKHYFETNDVAYRMLESCFSPELFVRNLNIDNKKRLIELICAKANMYFGNEIDTLKPTLEREEILSSELVNSTAVPHSFTCLAREAKVILITLKKPILWNDSKCQLIMYVINGQNESIPFSILSLIKEAINDVHFVYNIINANNFDEVKDSIRKWIESR